MFPSVRSSVSLRRSTRTGLQRELEPEALIVGGGPVGLALALGLHRKGMKVIVLEEKRQMSEDWSTAYSYRIDSRGISLLRELGMLAQIEAVAVPSEGFSKTVVKDDGTSEVVTGSAAISLGYWIQRPLLVKLLLSELPAGTLVDGKFIGLTREGTSLAMLSGDTISINASFVFGCDGLRSMVRQSLAAMEDLASDFQLQAIPTPSTGLQYRAVLFRPPDTFEPRKMYQFTGKSGYTLGLLPFAGEPGQARPLSFAQLPNHPLHSFKTADEVYSELEQDFPQMEVRRRLPVESAAAWCSSKGSTFPNASWCRAASARLGEVGVALLGDSLHSFPPDLGQGVNAGFSDVSSLLRLWPEVDSRIHQHKALKTYGVQQAIEAEAICRLLPIGMPYQYNLPFSFGKVTFFVSLLTRLSIHKLMPGIFTPPVIFLVTEAPPKKYSSILMYHQRNTRRLLLLVGSFTLLVALAYWKWKRV